MCKEIKPVTADARLRPKTSEVRRLKRDNQKLRSAAGFQPIVSLREGLARTSQWFLEEANLRKYKPDVYNV
jgi:nucleoside-diphosphate-sugar epimerase